VVAFVLARPTAASLAAGGIAAAAGEGLRVWAAGHLEKGREVTKSGPYRWTRHPLYVGSSIIGLGIAVASASLTVWALVAVYLAVSLTAAIRTEEAALTVKFGREYEEYRQGQLTDVDRRFSLARALGNREPRAAIGVAVGWVLLALKLLVRV
jgi:protein-S-isoprenylcysteine O-methyltransferase Ste14